MGRVIVVGSINIDLVATAPRIPRAMETVVGRSVTVHPGGKGANQAVAAHRLGVDVLLCGAVGSDESASTLAAFLAAEGIGMDHVMREPGPTGMAVVVVDDSGANSMVVVPGANDWVWASHQPRLDLDPQDVLLLQGEIPSDINLAALRQARAAGARTVLNLAPYRDTSKEALELVSYLIVNEAEFAGLVCHDDAEMGVDRVLDLLAEGAGPARDIAVTLGEAGVVTRVGGSVSHIQGHRVKVVDTTGAGDSFCGAFGASLVRGLEPNAAFEYANCAAAVSVQRAGAGPSMPTAWEVAAFLESHDDRCGKANIALAGSPNVSRTHA